MNENMAVEWQTKAVLFWIVLDRHTLRIIIIAKPRYW